MIYIKKLQNFIVKIQLILVKSLEKRFWNFGKLFWKQRKSMKKLKN